MAKSKALTVVKKDNHITTDRLYEDSDYRASVQVACERENMRLDREKAFDAAVESAFKAGIEYAVSNGITLEQWRKAND